MKNFLSKCMKAGVSYDSLVTIHELEDEKIVKAFNEYTESVATVSYWWGVAVTLGSLGAAAVVVYVAEDLHEKYKMYKIKRKYKKADKSNK